MNISSRSLWVNKIEDTIGPVLLIVFLEYIFRKRGPFGHFFVNRKSPCFLILLRRPSSLLID